MTRSKPTGELLSFMDNSTRKKRCEKVSQKKNYWLGTTAKSDEQHVAVIQHNKAKKAAKKSHKRAAASFQTPAPLEVRKSACHEGISQMLRRQAITYFYRLYFCDEPNIDDIITPIMKHCSIPDNSRRGVRKIVESLRKAQEEEEANLHPTKKQKLGSGGSEGIIREDSIDSIIICNLIQHGVSGAEVSSIINERWILEAKQKDLEIDVTRVRQISKNAIYGFIKRSPMIKRYRRMSKKTGKTDKESQWARSRVIQCNHYLKEMTLSYGMRPWPQYCLPLIVEEIVWFDEKHKQCILGCASKHEYLVARNVFDQNPTLPEFGGVFPKRMPRTNTSI